MTDLVVVLIVLGMVVLTVVALRALCQRSRAGANRRADLLVRELLTADELEQLQRYGYLTVPSGSRPGRIYRIPARPGLVTVLDAGKPVARLCLRPACWMPERDQILVHKLLLEGAEREYWQRANHLIGQLWCIADSPAVELWTGRPPGVLAQQ